MPWRSTLARMRPRPLVRLRVAAVRDGAGSDGARTIYAGESTAQWNPVLQSIAGNRVAVEVDSSLAHLWTVPWQPQLRRESHWLGFAAVRHQQLFGAGEGDWMLRLDAALPPAPRLAAALPLTLIGSLREALGARLVQIRVDVVDRASRWLAAHRRYSGMAIQVDHDGAWLWSYLGGRLLRVRRRRWMATHDVADIVPALASAARAEWAWAQSEAALGAQAAATPLKQLAWAPGPAPRASAAQLAAALGVDVAEMA